MGQSDCAGGVGGGLAIGVVLVGGLTGVGGLG